MNDALAPDDSPTVISASPQSWASIEAKVLGEMLGD
jgi:hypothetical protein